MAKTLVMTFMNAQGKKTSITIANVKENVTGPEVSSAMDTIIAKNIFSTNGGDLKTKDSANLTEKTTDELSIK